MATRKKGSRAKGPLIRAGAHHVELFNSGLEVWLYDDANADRIRDKGLWRKLVDGGKTDGMLVGYGLRQDDSLSVDLVVGKALTDKELSVAAWLAPQTALLCSPSGRLVVESNDSCRVSEEAADRTDEGALVEIPKGNYRMTLYRIDHETLARDERTWRGAQEVVVLTPGGTDADDAAGLLPFRESADLSFVGKREIGGRKATGLVWFDDFWDTFIANLDSAAVNTLGLEFGGYLRVTVPANAMTLVVAYAKDWKEGAKLKPPAGPKLPEFGFASVVAPERWPGTEVLFCRRVKATKGVAARDKTRWLDAEFEVLDAQAQPPATRNRAGALYAGSSRFFAGSSLAEKPYFDEDVVSLAMKLDGRLEGVTFDEQLPLPEAIRKLDRAMARLDLRPLGDFEFDLPAGDEPKECSARVWTGLDGILAAAWGSPDSFEVLFHSRTDAGKWILTGTIDADDAERISAMRPRLSVRGEDEAPFDKLLAAHRKHLREAGGKPVSIPGTLADVCRFCDDYLDALLG